MKRVLFALMALVFILSCEKPEQTPQDKNDENTENNEQPTDSPTDPPKDPFKIEKTEMSLFSQEEQTIKSNGTDCIYSSQNPFIASVDESGKVTALHVGETEIEVKAKEGSGKVKVTVKPKYNVIKDPYIKWGCSKDDIKKKFGTPTNENTSNIIYTETLEAHAITGYSFTNGELSSITVVLNPGFELEATKHLTERFQYWTKESNAYVFTDSMTETFSIYVLLTKVDGIWCIIYSPKK